MVAMAYGALLVPKVWRAVLLYCRPVRTSCQAAVYNFFQRRVAPSPVATRQKARLRVSNREGLLVHLN